MSTVTSALAGGRTSASQGSLAQTIDRWIFVFTASGFIVITLVGFVPDSLEKIAAVNAGARPPFPLALHFHAALMGAFLLLLLGQSVLQATGQRKYHRHLGIAGIALATTLVAVGFILVPTMYQQVWQGSQVAPPEAQAGIKEGLRTFEDIMLLQLQIGILFPTFLVIALSARKSDPGLHKRMMLLAITPALAASIDRIAWLPTSLPASPLTPFLYPLVAIAPLFIWDVFRNRAVHKAYLIWAAFMVPSSILIFNLWGSDWWHSIAPRLGGV
ncbi:MAG TPA: hypothetical protein VIA80_18600 [Hyphomonadaceae bacterium]